MYGKSRNKGSMEVTYSSLPSEDTGIEELLVHLNSISNLLDKVC